jgi:hypothetical protein
VIGPPPFIPETAYFFFLPAFLAAFFFAAIVKIPPFGPGMDREPPLIQHLG